VPPQVTRLETKTVDRIDYRFQQTGKPLCDFLHFFVEQLLGNIVVHISHEMNEAFLMRALAKRIIRSIEIGDENSTKIPEDLLKRAALQSRNYFQEKSGQ